jgi:threonine/homoserine/homoserine lactone efflux protein
VKAVGATYLLWLGYKAITSRSLISFAARDRQPRCCEGLISIAYSAYK